MTNEKDVGRFFTTDGEDIWKMIAFCSDPSATMMNVKTGEKVGGSIYSLNLKPFVRLLPEGTDYECLGKNN